MSEASENSPVTSSTQDQWVEICAAVRAGIAKQVCCIPAMDPSEVADLVRAIDLAIVVEATAGSYDALVEERRLTLERSSLFGE